jgi:hypothetical protein
MIARVIAISCAVVACGDSGGPGSDAGGAEPACGAVFRENFAETWTGLPGCAGLQQADGHTTLRLSIPSQTLAASLDIAIDLGAAPTPGTYTSQNLATPWSADAVHEFEMTSCLYHAGAESVPPGTFQLVLDEVDPRAHGTLDVMLYVLSRPYTYCGETNIERVAITF